MPIVTEGYVDARRLEILLAAHRCFAQNGFRGTTMQQIAAEAGLSAGALYRYFDGKQALIEGLAALGRDQIADELGGSIDESERAHPASALAALMRRLGSAADANETVRFDVRLWGEALGDGALEPVVAQGLEALRATIGRSLGGGRSSSGTRARILVSLLAGLELQMAFDAGFDVDDYAAAVERVVACLTD